MKRVRDLMRRAPGDDVVERADEVSADLPYELQSRMFDQLATMSIAGAGLSVTLIGSLLSDPPVMVWLSVPLFGGAALAAISGNERLILGLFKRQPTLKGSRQHVQLALGLIGMATGFLTMGIYDSVQVPDSKAGASRAAVEAAPPAPASR